ncbi:MAG: hypothetical protein JSV03_03030, partial [Planctomycetota bacterium]
MRLSQVHAVKPAGFLDVRICLLVIVVAGLLAVRASAQCTPTNNICVNFNSDESTLTVNGTFGDDTIRIWVDKIPAGAFIAEGVMVEIPETPAVTCSACPGPDGIPGNSDDTQVCNGPDDIPCTPDDIPCPASGECDAGSPGGEAIEQIPDADLTIIQVTDMMGTTELGVFVIENTADDEHLYDVYGVDPSGLTYPASFMFAAELKAVIDADTAKDGEARTAAAEALIAAIETGLPLAD